MYPDPSLRKPLHPMPRRQNGFLLPVAMFIIVVMGLAALALSRTTSQSNVAGVQELVSTQAFYAAESGIQAGLSEIFYPDASTGSTVDARCDALDRELDFTGIDGLNLCSARVECTLVEPGSYTLRSEGQCGSGDIFAERSVEVQARF